MSKLNDNFKYMHHRRFKCSVIFNSFIANCPQSVLVKELSKSVNIWQMYGQKLGGTFLLRFTVYIWLTIIVVNGNFSPTT